MDKNPRVPPSPEVWFTAAECARRTRLTVRALRVYERHGLITPPRTAKNWRLYGARELARLNEIIILKQLGLPLSRMAQLLAQRAVDLAGILALQATLLTEQRERLDRGLAMITGLRAKLEQSGRLSLDDLLQLANENPMSKATEDAIAWRLYEQTRPRTAVRLSRAILRQYAGHYRGIRGGSGTFDGVICSIKLVGSRLELQSPGWLPSQVAPEAPDKFFCKGMPFQVVFDRDDTGAVCGFVLHQDGYEDRAVRISRQAANASWKVLAARVAKKTPFPNSETLVRAVIANTRAGIVDETAVTPQLAQLMRDQVPRMKKEHAQLGRLKRLAFRGVTSMGTDVYDATFQRGQQQWRLRVRDDGKIAGLTVMPNPP